MAFERMTGQRRLILEAVLRADDHPTADAGLRTRGGVDAER